MSREKKSPNTVSTSSSAVANQQRSSGISAPAVQQPLPVIQQQLSSAPAVVQRMIINKVNITDSSGVNDIIKAMGWSKFGGVANPLTEKEKKELIRVINKLKETKKDDVLDSLLDDLVESSSEENEEEVQTESKDNTEQEEDDLDLGLPILSITQQAPKKARLETAEEFGWTGFPDNHDGYHKIGVHETSAENARGLVEKGPAVNKMDTGHHLGKGRGFYVTYVGRKQLATVTREIVYGEKFVAIYISDHVTPVYSRESGTDHTDILDESHGDKLCYYVMSGGGEIVIPERCFPFVRAVTVKDQLKQIPGESADDRSAVADYQEQLEFAKRMNDLSARYKTAQGSYAKKSILGRWKFLQNRLFNNWSMQLPLGSLWFETHTINEYVRPTPPSYRSNNKT